uniref:Uncharacterized protein n=1 Tax=Rhizophora mucronata TaxID=61149 RepID=A0A2P2PCH0_RHIMU
MHSMSSESTGKRAIVACKRTR